MTETLDWVRSLWERHALHMFAVDHPGNSECVGAHRPNQPCDGSRGKHPCGKWSRDASNVPAILRAAFSRGPRNIGVACGPSGLLVVDEDRDGALDEYTASIGQTIEATFTVGTAKGRHVYFGQPEGVPLGNSPGALAGRGIDIRGSGGFVVGPGSVHQTGVIYTPVDPEAPILPAPAWLIEALRTKSAQPPAPRSTRTRGTAKNSTGLPFRVLSSLVQVVLDATPDVDRNSRLFWAACQMHKHANRGLFAAEAGRAALLEAARRVGLAYGEAEMTLDSAARNVGRCT